MLTTWRKLIAEEMDLHGDSWGDVYLLELKDELLHTIETTTVLDKRIDDTACFGGLRITVWTPNYLYIGHTVMDCAVVVSADRMLGVKNESRSW